jgi:ATP-dependent helicase/nuclease subunit A
MEAIPLHEPLTQGALLVLVENLVHQGILTPGEKEVLDLESIYAFWRSELGTAIHQNHTSAHRELPFTTRFNPNELTQLGIPTTPDLDPNEFIVVQGVVDLAIILPDTIWIVDFKTDHVDADAAEDRARDYRPQLQLYASALSRIYQRPVSRLWLHFLYPRLTLPIESPVPGP